MATIRKRGIGYWGLGIKRRRARFPIPNTQYLLFLLFFLSACTSVRPVAKIGLIAPFEGLYRQEGYDALAAMRAGLADRGAAGVDVLPLALDSSRDVARTAQKVLADPSVTAVIGPYWAGEGRALAGLAQGTKWRRPYAPSGADAWAVEALALAEDWAETQGRRLVLAGDVEMWPESDSPVAASPQAVTGEQAVLWLGDPAGGADFAAALWKEQSGVPFGIYGGGMAALRDRLGEGTGGPLFLLAWIDDDYTSWRQNHTPNTPAAYAVYRLTVDAIAELAGERPATVWQPAIFTLSGDELRLAFRP